MKILIHIGRPKTGTTSLQQFLYQNRDALSEAGYYLLDGAGRPNNIEIPAYFNRSAAPGLLTWRRRRGIATIEEKQAYFRAMNFPNVLSEQIRAAACDHHTLVITSEHLTSCLHTAKEILAFAAWAQSEGDSARVVGFVRNQVELLPSGWSTAVRAGGTQSLSDRVNRAVNRLALDYSRWANQWTGAFGPANTQFHVYKSHPSWDIRRYFAEHYLPEVTRLMFRPSRSNPAYGRVEAELVRAINQLWPRWKLGEKEANPKNERARMLVSRMMAGRDIPLRLGTHQERRVRAAFAQSNARFVSQYLPDNGEL